MRHLMSSTILAAALTLPGAGLAQTAIETLTIETETGQSPEIEVATSDVIGSSIYVNRQGTAGNQDLSQGVAQPLGTWYAVAEITDIATDGTGRIETITVTPDAGGDTQSLPLDDVIFIRDTDTPDQVFVLISRTSDAFDEMAPFETAGAGQAMPEDGFARATPYTDADVAAEDALGMQLYAGSVDETSRGLFDLSNAPANWTALGEIDAVVPNNGGENLTFILHSGGFLGIGGTDHRVQPDHLAFVRNTEGTLFAIYTGPRSAFPERLEAVDS